MINRHDINEIMIDFYYRINISNIIYENQKIYDMQKQIQRFKKKRNKIKKQLLLFKQNIDHLIERENYFYFIDLLSSNNFSLLINFSSFFYTSIQLNKRIKNIIDNLIFIKKKQKQKQKQ